MDMDRDMDSLVLLHIKLRLLQLLLPPFEECVKMPLKEGRNHAREQNPSFSSTLLDKIYGGDEDEGGGRIAKAVAPPSSVKEKRGSRDCDGDHDVAYFSSTSISSDSSSGGVSSSDTDSFHGAKTKASCFAPLMIRPVKTHAASAKAEKVEGSQPKSKALAAYETLRKVRQQPVSPGGKLTSLLNSIFTSSSKKKGRSHDDASLVRDPKSRHASTCSSATSFSRACINNGYSSRSGSAVISLRDEPRDVAAAGSRSVRFCPVNAVVGEDQDHPRRPCSRTSRRDESEGISKSCRVKEKATWWMLEDMKRRIEETRRAADGADDDDGSGSCSSSDLFEIDHLSNPCTSSSHSSAMSHPV